MEKEYSNTKKSLIGDISFNSEIDEILHNMCDKIGKRWVGTRGEQDTFQYLLKKMDDYQLNNVHGEEFYPFAWERGSCQVNIMSPFKRKLNSFALPNVGTHTVEASLFFATDFSPSDWRSLSSEVRGKIVVASEVKDSGFPKFPLSRSDKAMKALEAGAVGFIWVGTHTGQLPSTGSINPLVGEEVPCVTISKEDFSLLQRISQRDRVIMSIKTDNKKHETKSYNVVGEIEGSGYTGEDVIMCTAHYDGHDITDAAHDNAAGTAVMLEAARALRRNVSSLNAKIRFVIFSAEEIGCLGSFAYSQQHLDSLNNIRFLFNADGIGFLPSSRYMHVPLGGEVVPYLQNKIKINKRPIEVEHKVRLNWDHAPFAVRGVPCGSETIKQDSCVQPHWGHTAADTLDKLDLEELKSTACDIALLVYDISQEQRQNWPGKKLSTTEAKEMLKTGAKENQIEGRINRWNESLVARA